MKVVKLCPPVVLLLSFILYSLSAIAQSTTAGDINGVVTDPSGAVIVNAKVTVKSDSTGASHTTSTNNEGFYRFPLLEPGVYTLTVDAPNLQQATRKATVGVGQVTGLNISMAVATAITTVEVTGEGLQVDNADNSTNFGSEQIALIPNPGNDLSSVAQTAPGIMMNTQSGDGNFSAYGLPGTSNLFTLDGQNDNDPFLNLNNSGATNLLLGTNEVSEATVVTNGYSGQYGQLAGAQVNYVTKSGGNKFHGNAVYYWNGRTMNANNYFNNQASSAADRPFDNVNQWAVSVGGPIVKDKTFFFFDYEGLRVVLPTSAPAFIPSAQFQASTLANLASTSPASVPFFQNIFNLYNAAPGAAGAVASSTCGALGVAGPGLAAGDPCVNRFQSTAGNFTHEFLAALRIDHKFTENDSIFGRVQSDHGVQATITDPINSAFNVQSDQPEYQGQLGWTHIAGANAVNEFKMSGQWYSAIFTNPDRNATLSAFPTTLQLGDGSLSTLGGVVGEIFPQGRNVTGYQFVDDFSLSRGKHTFKIGVNYHRNDVTDFSPQEFVQGVVTVNSLQDLLNGGIPTADEIATGAGSDSLLQHFPNRQSDPVSLYGVGFYGQDEWRVTPHLRLTLALRLDHNSNPVCGTNCFARLTGPFSTLDHDPNVPYNAVIQTGLNQAYPSTDMVVWQPRIGFAWSPFGKEKTVIRGGIGIFSDSFPATIADSFLQNSPNINAFNAANLAISPAAANNLFTVNGIANSTFQNGFASGETLGQIQSDFAGNPQIGGAVLFVPPNFTSSGAEIRQPRYQEWNLEIQQELGWSTFLSVNYVGNHGIFEPVQNAAVNAFGFGGLHVQPL